jgi:hypothetical protein
MLHRVRNSHILRSDHTIRDPISSSHFWPNSSSFGWSFEYLGKASSFKPKMRRRISLYSANPLGSRSICYSFKTYSLDQMLDELEFIDKQMPYQSDVSKCILMGFQFVTVITPQCKKVNSYHRVSFRRLQKW